MDSNRSNVKVTSTALAPLQPSPKGTMLVGRRPRSQVTSGSLKNRIIVGKSGKIGSPKLTRVNRPSTKDSATTTVTIFNAASEAQTDISMVDLNSTTNKRDSVIQMLTSAHPSGQYFELLAEERRVALAEALNENEKLWMQIRKLRHEVIHYRDLAEKGENYANLLREILELKDEKSIEDYFSS